MIAQEPARLRQSPLQLVLRALGPPRAVAGKLSRLGQQVAGMANPRALDARLQRLHARGRIEALPTRAQLTVGAIDMLRFWISPAAAEYYAARGISYGFHQLLRVLDEPASVTDPIGLFSSRDGIVGHLMQVVHANPVYDLELLDMFDDGLDSLESQIETMLAGTHPRAESIRAIVEESDYHARLLQFVRAWRIDPANGSMLRKNVQENPRWAAVERTFGSLRTSFRYFCRLPSAPREAIRHLVAVAEFPHALAEPG